MKTRKYLGPAKPPNLIAQLMGGSSVGHEPDGSMSPEIAAFNIAIVGTDEWHRDVFLAIYCTQVRDPVKKVAHQLNTSPATMYRIANKVADDLVRRTRKTVSEFEIKQVREN